MCIQNIFVYICIYTYVSLYIYIQAGSYLVICEYLTHTHTHIISAYLCRCEWQYKSFPENFSSQKKSPVPALNVSNTQRDWQHLEPLFDSFLFPASVRRRTDAQSFFFLDLIDFFASKIGISFVELLSSFL